MAISRFENYDPMLFQSQPMEYASKLPGDLLLKAGAVQQEKFDKGVALADAATGLLDKLAPAPGHEDYKRTVVNKYNQKIDDVIKGANGNYGDAAFQRNVVKLASEIANDSDVNTIKTSKDYYDKYMAPYISDPKYSYDIKGIKNFDAKTGAWTQNTDLYASMNNIPYADMEKRLNEAMAQIKPTGDFTLGTDPKIKTIATPDGTSYMYDLSDSYTKGVYAKKVQNVLNSEAGSLAMDPNNPYTRYFTAEQAQRGINLADEASIKQAIYNKGLGLVDKFTYGDEEIKRHLGMLPQTGTATKKTKEETPPPPTPVNEVPGQTTGANTKYDLSYFTPGGGPTFKTSKKGEGMSSIPLEFTDLDGKPTSKTFNVSKLPEKEKKLAEGVMRSKFPSMYKLYQQGKLSGEDQLKVANYIKQFGDRLLAGADLANNQAIGLTSDDQEYNNVVFGLATKGNFTVSDIANNAAFNTAKYYDFETGEEITGAQLYEKAVKDGAKPETGFTISNKLSPYNNLSVLTNNENYTGGNFITVNNKTYVQEAPRAYVDPVTNSTDNAKMQSINSAKDLSRIYNAGGALGLKEEESTIDLSFANNVTIRTKVVDMPDGSRVKMYSDKKGKSWTTDPSQLYQAFSQIATNAQQTPAGGK